MFETSDQPHISERYATACNSSNLRVESEKGSAADLMIAAGWLPSSEVGSALLRLHTKYSRHGLEHVHNKIMDHLKQTRVLNQSEVASSVIAWWLSKLCKTCNGVKFKLIEGTPSLSAKHCTKCRGTGKCMLPHGEAGKKIARWLDECVERARAGISRRLYTMR